MTYEAHIRLLQEARRMVENRHHAYICHALATAWMFDAGCPRQVLMDLDVFIYRALSPHSRLESWLIARGEFTLDDYRKQEPWLVEKLRLTRLAWLDAMIEEFKRREEDELERRKKNATTQAPNMGKASAECGVLTPTSSGAKVS